MAAFLFSRKKWRNLGQIRQLLRSGMEGESPIVFTLFRAQVFLPKQRPLLNNEMSPSEILSTALLEKPTVQQSGGHWHIGNVQSLSDKSLYFAVGRQQPRRFGKLDAEGNFRDEEALVAPNTHVLLDLRFQVFAIAKNSELAPEPRSVALKLEKLLQATAVAIEQDAKISIDEIEDPSEFIQLLLDAAAVTRFQVSFALPNVWDVEEDFQKPFQETARELKATDSTASFKGDDLERKKLVTITRAASAVGKRAKAWIKRRKDGKAVMIKQEKNAATVISDPVDESHLVRWADENIEIVRAYYESIRDRE